MREVTFETVEEAAREYVDCLNTPPNGYGAHYHPTYGRSDNFRYLICCKFRTDITDAAIDAEFAKRRAEHAPT